MLQFHLTVDFDEKDLEKFGELINKGMDTPEGRTIVQQFVDKITESIGRKAAEASTPKKETQPIDEIVSKMKLLPRHSAATQATLSTPAPEPTPITPPRVTAQDNAILCTCGEKLPITTSTKKGKPRKEVICPKCKTRYKLKPPTDQTTTPK